MKTILFIALALFLFQLQAEARGPLRNRDSDELRQYLGAVRESYFDIASSKKAKYTKKKPASQHTENDLIHRLSLERFDEDEGGFKIARPKDDDDTFIFRSKNASDDERFIGGVDLDEVYQFIRENRIRLDDDEFPWKIARPKDDDEALVFKKTIRFDDDEGMKVARRDDDEIVFDERILAEKTSRSRFNNRDARFVTSRRDDDERSFRIKASISNDERLIVNQPVAMARYNDEFLFRDDDEFYIAGPTRDDDEFFHAGPTGFYEEEEDEFFHAGPTGFDEEEEDEFYIAGPSTTRFYDEEDEFFVLEPTFHEEEEEDEFFHAGPTRF